MHRCTVGLHPTRGSPTTPRAARTGTNAKERHILVLTRKADQSIMIGDDIEISVLSVMGEKVRIGIAAPRDVPVFRTEVYLEIQQGREAGEGAEPITGLPELEPTSREADAG